MTLEELKQDADRSMVEFSRDVLGKRKEEDSRMPECPPPPVFVESETKTEIRERMKQLEEPPLQQRFEQGIESDLLTFAEYEDIGGTLVYVFSPLEDNTPYEYPGLIRKLTLSATGAGILTVNVTADGNPVTFAGNTVSGGSSVTYDADPDQFATDEIDFDITADAGITTMLMRVDGVFITGDSRITEF